MGCVFVYSGSFLQPSVLRLWSQQNKRVSVCVRNCMCGRAFECVLCVCVCSFAFVMRECMCFHCRKCHMLHYLRFKNLFDVQGRPFHISTIFIDNKNRSVNPFSAFIFKFFLFFLHFILSLLWRTEKNIGNSFDLNWIGCIRTSITYITIRREEFK